MRKKVLKIILIGLFILYISYLLYLTLLSPYYGRGIYHRSINIVPFKTIIQFMTFDNLRGSIINILGNIAAFAPLGFILPLTFKRLRSITKLIPIILFSTIAIELLQYILYVGTSDIDDIILNFLGGIIGFLFFKISHVIVGLIKGIK